MSKTRSLHHIVFATKHREMTIPEDYKRELYAYILGITRNRGCHLIRINGIGNHIHILLDVHPSVALADIVKTVKQWSSHWLKNNPRFPMFEGWGKGYYAVSLGVDGMEGCRQYIIGQEAHHLKSDLLNEMEVMARDNGLAWYRDDWE